MDFFRKSCGLRNERVKNNDVRRSMQIEKSVADEIHEGQLTGFIHTKRMKVNR